MRFAAVASAVEAMMQESVTDGNPESRCKRVDSEAMSRRVNRTENAYGASYWRFGPLNLAWDTVFRGSMLVVIRVLLIRLSK